MVWHAIGLPRALLQRTEALHGVHVAHYLADYSPELPDEYLVYWQAKPVSGIGRLAKCVLAPLALRILASEGKPIRLRYEHVLCVSEYVRGYLVGKGLIGDSAQVVHNGVDLGQFDATRFRQRRFIEKGLRCLVAGRVCAEKGVHTAVEALGLLHRQGVADNIRLTILGDGPPGYASALRDRVRTLGLSSLVTFRQPAPREEMPEILSEHDVLLVPSEYQEPLARSTQEGMAMGLLVVGTITGGSGELLVDRQTGFVFLPGDAGALAACLHEAWDDRDRAQRLAQAGREAVVAHFDIRGTTAAIERYLTSAIAGI